jgi:PKD repeat protein
MLGDAFSQLYYEVPQQLMVTHDPEIPEGGSTFSITTNMDSTFVALTVNNEIIGTGYGMQGGSTITILPQVAGTQVLVTVTKQNYYRYSSFVPVTNQQIAANFSANITGICTSGTVDFSDLSTGSPETWSWTFEGATPSTSTDQNPAGIKYDLPGNYSVTLTVGKTGQDPQTTTKTEYIHVSAYPVADFSTIVSCAGTEHPFTDLSTVAGGTLTNWEWDFGDPASGTNNTSTLQNPVHIYGTPGVYSVKLTVMNNGLCLEDTLKTVTVITLPADAAIPTGAIELCQGTVNNPFTTAGALDAESYIWEISPVEAGIITGSSESVNLELAPAYIGPATIKVKGINACGESAFSPELSLTVKANPLVPAAPTGIDSVKTNTSVSSDFTTSGGEFAETYAWFIDPSAAGVITGTGTTGTVNWTSDYRGTATITVKSVNTCGQSAASGEKIVTLWSTLGIGDNGNGYGFEIYPNPNNGKFNLKFNKSGNYSVNINLYDALGNIVFTENNVSVTPGGFVKVIDLTTLSQGVYNLKVEGVNGVDVKKILIRK